MTENLKENLESREEKIRQFRKLVNEIYQALINKPEIENSFFDDLVSRKNKEWLRYLFWHILIGSTPSEDVTELDTPDHEIESFAATLHEKYTKN
jgi:hypothetical protein